MKAAALMSAALAASASTVRHRSGLAAFGHCSRETLLNPTATKGASYGEIRDRRNARRRKRMKTAQATRVSLLMEFPLHPDEIPLTVEEMDEHIKQLLAKYAEQEVAMTPAARDHAKHLNRISCAIGFMDFDTLAKIGIDRARALVSEAAGPCPCDTCRLLSFMPAIKEIP